MDIYSIKSLANMFLLGLFFLGMFIGILYSNQSRRLRRHGYDLDTMKEDLKDIKKSLNDLYYKK